jgi:photosystem II stability/assembly factor-like uncharacterized protein
MLFLEEPVEVPWFSWVFLGTTQIYARKWISGFLSPSDGAIFGFEYTKDDEFGPGNVGDTNMSRLSPILRIAFLGIALLVAWIGAACAATWRSAGPDGGDVYVLAVDPTDPDVVYASTGFRSVLKTTDGGESWRALPFPAGSAGGLAIDPRHPDTLYAAVSYQGIFRSADGGESWKAVWTNTVEWVAGGGIRIDPARGTIYVQFGSGMLRSTNDGATWRWIRPPFRERLTSFVLDPVWPDVLYVSAELGGIARSTDAGQTWKLVGRPSQALALLRSIAVEPGPGHKRRIYAAAWQGLQRSDDGGTTWTPVWHEPDRTISRVAFAGKTLYALTTASSSSMESRASLLRSSDGGNTWERAGAGLFAHELTVFAAAPSDPRTLYVAPLAQGVFRSRDGAESWTRANRGLLPTPVLSLSADPSQPGHLLVGTGGAGVLATRDAGATWTVDPRPSHLFYAFGLKRNPARPQRVFAASQDRLVRSEDGGTTWTSTGPSGFEDIFALDPDHTDILYAESRDGVQRSQDGGATWELVAEPLACMFVGQLLVVPGSGALIARTFARISPTPSCAFVEGYNRSWDGGASWTPITSRLPSLGGFLQTDPSTPGVLYLLGSDLATSMDAGDTWTVRGQVPATGSVTLASLLVTPGAYYLGGEDGIRGRVWVSHDAGASWSAFGPPIELDLVGGLAIDQGVLWAVTTFGGLRRLDAD